MWYTYTHTHVHICISLCLLLCVAGVAKSGCGQAVISLIPNTAYYVTVRAVTNAGNVLQTVTDGVTVDVTPPTITFDRYMSYIVKHSWCAYLFNVDILVLGSSKQDALCSYIMPIYNSKHGISRSVLLYYILIYV
jgi:hypothetical protein